MVSGLARFGASVSLIVSCVWPVSAADFDQYREFRLGSSTAAVIDVTRMAGMDLKTVHQRPALLQRLAWRPRYTTGRTLPDVDPVREIVFTFLDDQLFKIAVEYERNRTAGLTNEDMIASLAPIYGPRSAIPAEPRPRAGYGAVDSPTLVAQWRNGDTAVALQHTGTSDGFELVITSVPMELLARKAQATAVSMDTREAPAREAALAKKRADDARAAEEKTRTTNKETFRP